MEATEITDEADIIFSDSAAGRVAQLIKEEKNPELRLRVYITGGCLLYTSPSPRDS